MSDKNHLNTKWAALIERCEMGNENGAEEVLKQLRKHLGCASITILND